ESLRMPKGSNISKSAPDGQKPTHFKVLSGGVELLPHELPVQSAARGIEVRGNEHEVVFDDGERRHFYGNAMPLRDEAGKVRGGRSGRSLTSRPESWPRSRSERPTGGRTSSWRCWRTSFATRSPRSSTL